MNVFAFSSTKIVATALAGAAVATFLTVAPMAFAHKPEGNDNKGTKAGITANVNANIRAAISHVEVVIGQGGKVHVKGATVTAVNGSTITATTQWGAPTLTWTLATNASTTKFTAEGSGKTTIGTIAVGDKLSFEGKLATTTSGFLVNVKTVKELK
jgi:hypothetical protein